VGWMGGAVGGTRVSVGGTGVSVGAGVSVGGIGVAVGGAGVLEGGIGVSVGGTGVGVGTAVGGAGVAVGTACAPHAASTSPNDSMTTRIKSILALDFIRPSPEFLPVDRMLLERLANSSQRRVVVETIDGDLPRTIGLLLQDCHRQVHSLGMTVVKPLPSLDVREA
jgi:hypothetical protein